MREIWVASTNIGKLREFEKLLAPLFIVKSTKDIPAYTAPPETGKTFLENATIKAKFLRAIKPNEWVLADDSGLEVAGLGGLPGVHSSTYAGQNAKDLENTLRVIKMLQLKAVVDRSAKLVSQLVVYSPDGKVHVFEGVLEGQIAKEPKGTEGFGYDSVFIPHGETKTLAELGLAIKNKLSHRSKAIQLFADFVRPLL